MSRVKSLSDLFSSLTTSDESDKNIYLTEINYYTVIYIHYLHCKMYFKPTAFRDIVSL